MIYIMHVCTYIHVHMYMYIHMFVCMCSRHNIFLPQTLHVSANTTEWNCSLAFKPISCEFHLCGVQCEHVHSLHVYSYIRSLSWDLHEIMVMTLRVACKSEFTGSNSHGKVQC